MDTMQCLEWEPKDVEIIPIAHLIEWMQQATAQLAAIREAVEHELAQQILKRRRETGWPPHNAEPISHIG